MRQSTFFSLFLLTILLGGFIPILYPAPLTFHPETEMVSNDIMITQRDSAPLPLILSEVNQLSKSNPLTPAAPDEIQAILNQITTSTYQTKLSKMTHGFGSRVWGSLGNQLAVDYISTQFESYGLNVTHHYFGTGPPNVIGTLPGGSQTNNQCIIVGAHLDTYPTGSPGADDNGSGVAAVLEIARVLSQYVYNYTIMFVAFNAEEQFLMGSTALAADLAYNNVSVAIVYNFDMLLWDSPSTPETIKTHIVHNGGESAWFAQHATDIGHDWVGAPVQALQNAYWVMSDHSPFWNHHMPAVWFFEYDGLSNPFIHSVADSLSQPEYSAEIGALATKTAAGAVADFATIVSTQTGFPEITFITPTSEHFVEPNNHVPIVLSVDDALNDVTYLELSIDGGPWINVTSGLNTTHCEYLFDATGMYGAHTISARAYDAEGWITRTAISVIFDKGIHINIHSPQTGAILPEGQEHTIWINVTDPDGRYVPTVQVRINNTSWVTAIEHIRNFEYYYSWIPTGSATIDIEARVFDGNGNQNSSLVQVTTISYPPIVTGVWLDPPTPLNTDPVRIFAEITQDSRGSGIDQVLVFYSVDYSNWRPRLMELIESDIAFGIYMVTLDPAPSGAQVRFYIQARDNFNNIAIDNNDGLYYVYYVGTNLTTALIVGAVISVVIIAGLAYYFIKYRRRERPTPT
ncbi:MAG: M28 family metallopeptidase [Promethearchaeota archaeon]